MEEYAAEDLGGHDVSLDNSEHQPADGLSVSTIPISDGCVTAHSDDFVAGMRADPEPALEEDEFAAGVNRASSPRVGLSSANPLEDVHMEEQSATMCADAQSDTANESEVSSELPVINIAPSQSYPGLVGWAPNPSFPVHSHVSDLSASSSHISSVSNHLPILASLEPPPPPPLAEVSLSEVQSCSSTELLSSAASERPSAASVRRGPSMPGRVRRPGTDRSRRMCRTLRSSSRLVHSWLQRGIVGGSGLPWDPIDLTLDTDDDE